MYSPDEIAELSDAQLWNALTETEGLEKCFILKELGRRAFRRRNYVEAATMANQAATLAADIDDHRLAGECRFDEGSAIYNNDELTDCRESYAKALEEFRLVGDQLKMAEALCRMSSIDLDLNEYDKCLEHAQSAYEFGRAEDNWWFSAYSSYYLACANYNLDEEELALENLEVARHYFRKRGDLLKVAMVDDYAATVHSYLGNEEIAVNLLRSCVHIAETTDQADDDPYAFRRLGSALNRIGRYEEAQDYLERAHTLYRSRNQHRLAALMMRDIADNLNYLDRAADALTKFEQAQSVLDSLGDDPNARYCKMRRSQIHNELGQFQNAERLARQVYLEVVSDKNLQDYDYVYWVGLHLAENLLQLDRFQDVLDVTIELDDSRAKTNPNNLVWKKTLRARSLYYLDRDLEALSEAESALALTTDENLSASTAYLYEIRAHSQLSEGRKSGERDLAHSIAIHLAAGADSEARELAKYFMPKLNQDENLGLGMVDAEVDLANFDGIEPRTEGGAYQFGFHPTE